VPDPAQVSRDAALLGISGLTVGFATDEGAFVAAKALDLQVSQGETVAIVGESGSGKFVTALATTGLIDYASGRIDAGQISPRDRAGTWVDLARASQAEMRLLRGRDPAMTGVSTPTASRLRGGPDLRKSTGHSKGVGHSAFGQSRRAAAPGHVPPAVAPRRACLASAVARRPGPG